MNNKAQALIEYLILVAVIAIASLGIVRLLGHTLQAKLAQVTAQLQGKSAKSIKVETIKQNHWKMKDMGNFYGSEK